MMKLPFYLLLFSFIWSAVIGGAKNNCTEGIELIGSSTHKLITVNNTDGSRKLCIFCHPGQKKTWLHLWINPKITIGGVNKVSVDDLSIYYGNNVSDVKSQKSGSILYIFNFWHLLKEEHSFSPFNYSCIGLESAEAYVVNFRLKNPELWYLAYIAVGVVIFFFARSWSRNTAFHYGTGVTVGVLASVLIVMFLLTRLMPQRLKTVSYVVMVVSSSASLFMFQLVKYYLQEIIQDHWQMALGYVVVAALLSFSLIYRFGPISDDRTLNLVCWLLQGLGLIFIYQGTQIPEASAAIILLVLTIYICPKSLPRWVKSLWFRFFPPGYHLLTEEEYIEEGEVETKKALKELRDYCNSPECNSWRVISCIKSPHRFADFVSGASDLSDDEIHEHENFNNYYSRSYLTNSMDNDAEETSGILNHHRRFDNNSDSDSDADSGDGGFGIVGYR